jgi:hypothetical protein
MIAGASVGDPFGEQNYGMEPDAMKPNYCPRCGHELAPGGQYCPQCAFPIRSNEGFYNYLPVSPHSRLIALVLCVLLGYLGVHRFYVGRVVSGLIWMFTGGLLGIRWLIDIILITTANFRDSEGLRVLDWD